MENCGRLLLRFCAVAYLLLVLSLYTPHPFHIQYTGIQHIELMPEKNARVRLYAIATILLHAPGAGARLCESIRSHPAYEELDDYVDVIALLPPPPTPPPENLSCFHHLLPLFPRSNTYPILQIWEQVQYKRIVYLDVDVIVKQYEPLRELLYTPIDFGAVRKKEMWKTDLLVIEPSSSMAHILRQSASSTLPFDTYLSLFFKEDQAIILPEMYNLDLEIVATNRKNAEQRR